MTAKSPDPKSVARIRKYVDKYRAKTGTAAHPNSEVPEGVVLGLASNLEEVGRPLCPCNFYPDKQQEVNESRRWFCACDEMKQYKYCHCLLFTNEEGLPITEYLPEDHEGRQTYGLVEDPTPDKGREGKSRIGKS